VRLSALDSSFLAVETPRSPMHVGWVAEFGPPEHGPRPTSDDLLELLAARMERAPRWRQRLLDVPLGLHGPEWVDDETFDAADHLHPAEPGETLDELTDRVLSFPLERNRPLWDMWVHDDLPGGGVAIVGKAHHCMVDGVAAMQLANLTLDRDPERVEPEERSSWTARSPASAPERLGRAVLDRAADGAALALTPLKLAPRFARAPGAVRTLVHTVLPPAPASPLNQEGSAQRHHVRVTRPLDELRTVRRRLGGTPNDVILASAAGALRAFQLRRGEEPQPLKAMVPADVRAGGESDAGNRIAFLFIELPCDEPDAAARLRAVVRATGQRRRDGEAEDMDAAFRVLARTPRTLQQALAHAFAHPRLFNLVVSSVPGPAPARFLHGCRLKSIHSAVPLAARHALSIGVLTVAGNACFGLYADAETLPDADMIAGDIEHALDELLAAAAAE
jgi:diacylglycerol O-acyltransferase / wax synthase